MVAAAVFRGRRPGASVPVEITVREAQATDAEAWARLRGALWPDCSLERHRLEIAQLSRSAGVVALAVGAGEPVGFARGYREMASDAELENEASILLHGRRGFVEVGRTVHFVKAL